MMKKLLALLTALMLLMGCSAALAQTGITREDYIGYWVLEDVKLGSMSLMADGAEGFAAIHEDDTVIISLDGEDFFAWNVRYEGGKCMMNNGSADFAATLSGDRLTISGTLEGSKIELICRAGKAPAVPAQIAAWKGDWDLTEVIMDGIPMNAVNMAQYSLSMYDEGYGMLHLGDMNATFRLWEEADGSVHGIDVDGVAFVMWEEGDRLCLSMPDADLTFKAERVATAAQSSASSDATVFEGVWHAESYELMGMVLAAEDLDMYVTLTVTGTLGILDADGDKVSCMVEAEGNTCVLTDGTSDTIPCELQEDGRLRMEMESDGVVLVIYMVREGGAPVVPQTPVATQAPAPAASDATVFEGVWHAESYELMGMVLAAEDLDMYVTLTVAGTKGILDADGDKVACVVEAEGNTCVLTDGTSDTIPCELQEDGRLRMEMESDGVVLVIYMVREGGAPAVPQATATPAPAAATPAPTAAPAAGAPANGFDGVWNIVQVERGGVIAPAAEQGVTGSLKVTGESARYTIGSSSSLGILTIDGNTLSLTARGKEYVFVLNAQGWLCLNTTIDGADVVLYLAREGSEPAAPVASATATPAPAAPAQGFDGHWKAEKCEVMGMVFTMEELGIEGLEVIISGSTAKSIYNGKTDNCTVTVDGDRIIIFDGKMEIPFYYDANGQAVMELTSDGITIKAYMTYIGE